MTSSLRHLFLLLAFTLAGCATHMSKPAGPVVASKIRFGEFQAVEMKSITIAKEFEDSGPNQKAKNKIEELLFARMAMAFPNLHRVNTEFSHSDVRTLQIEPHIKEIKFIGGAARFFVGAMAGGSGVLMSVTYRDSKTGEIIANPEFLRDASGFAGGASMGGADNQVLDSIAVDVVNYSTMNR